MIVCHCHAVRADDIRTEVRLGAETVDLVSMRCRASTRCGGCRPTVEAIVNDELVRCGAACGQCDASARCATCRPAVGALVGDGFGARRATLVD